MSEKIVVKIDIELQDIVPGFVENRKKELPLLLEAVEKGDFTTLQTFGHRLRGSAGGYGFEYLGTLGLLLEDSAKEKNMEKIEPILKKMQNFLKNLEIVYETKAS